MTWDAMIEAVRTRRPDRWVSMEVRVGPVLFSTYLETVPPGMRFCRALSDGTPDVHTLLIPFMNAYIVEDATVADGDVVIQPVTDGVQR